MENINLGIACDVKECTHNHEGCNCTLDKIHVGHSCDKTSCTCCENFTDKI